MGLVCKKSPNVSLSLHYGKFISVSNSLPMTSYVKMIDIWLLFNLIVPFVEVFLQTYIENIRSKIEEKKEMNHHGTTIVVQTTDQAPEK